MQWCAIRAELEQEVVPLHLAKIAVVVKGTKVRLIHDLRRNGTNPGEVSATRVKEDLGTQACQREGALRSSSCGSVCSLATNTLQGIQQIFGSGRAVSGHPPTVTSRCLTLLDRGWFHRLHRGLALLSGIRIQPWSCRYLRAGPQGLQFHC